MLSKFLSYIQEQNIDLKAHISLLSVSGGVDSMVMALLFHKANFPCAIAHINHNTRGLESDLDHELVREWAYKNELPFHELILEKEFAKGSNFQARARELRRSWLKTVCETYHYDYIVTAHHCNDNVESFFINLLRGSGLKGLSGMNFQNEIFIKPLLPFSRSDIEQYAEENNIKFRNDSSNESTIYLRNRIRHEIISKFTQEELWAMTRSVEKLRDSEDLLRSYINDDDIVKRSQEGIIIDRDVLLSKKGHLTQLWYVCESMNFTESQLRDILKTQNNSATVQSQSHTVVYDRGLLYIMPNKECVSAIIINNEGKHILSDGRIIEVKYCSMAEVDFTTDSNYMGFNIRPFPFMVRPFLFGDRFHPLGMKKGSQRISDYISNIKLNPIEKRKLVVMSKDGEIICLVGQQVDERYKVRKDVEFILQVKIS